MIASDRKAVRVGSGALLVVDGTDETLNRKAQFSLVAPGRVASRRLAALVALSAEVYNATIEHRRGAWKTAGISITRFDQFNEIPEMMAARPDVAAFGSRFVRGSISKADEAFAAFFRRLRDGEKPGYPRFKSTQRFSSVFYDEQKTGPCGASLHPLGPTILHRTTTRTSRPPRLGPGEPKSPTSHLASTSKVSASSPSRAAPSRSCDA